MSRLAAGELGVVLVLAALSLISERFLLPALGAALFFRLVSWAESGRPVPRTPLSPALAGLLVMLPVTLWATPLPETSWPQALRLALGVGVCWATAGRIRGRRGLALAAGGLAGVGLVLAGGALATVSWMTEEKLSWLPLGLAANFPRWTGESVHPNVMAGALVQALAFLCGWWLFDGRRLRWPARWGLAALCVLLGVVLALTKSRGAYLGLAGALGLLALLRWPKWGWGVWLAAGAGAGLVLWQRPELLQVVLTEQHSAASQLQGRLDIWSRAVFMLQDFPLTGIGMGTFTAVADKLYPFSINGPGSVTHAHNLFLQVGVDLGVPGLVCWLAGLLGAAGCGWRVYRQADAPEAGALVSAGGVGAGLLAATAALALHGVFDAVTWGTRPALLVWGMWGLAAAAWRWVEVGDE
jgi:putative inorganic carbon (HCO3(-)) transporter